MANHLCWPTLDLSHCITRSTNQPPSTTGNQPPMATTKRLVRKPSPPTTQSTNGTKRLLKKSTSPLPPIGGVSGTSRSTKKEPTPKGSKRQASSAHPGHEVPVIAHGLEDVPELPKESGPPPVKQGDGHFILTNTSGAYTIQDLDTASFRWLWEMAEAHARKHYNQYRSSMPHVSEAGIRAVLAIRRTYWAQHQPGEPVAKPKRRLKRKSS